jgi:hypothetical protein
MARKTRLISYTTIHSSLVSKHRAPLPSQTLWYIHSLSSSIYPEGTEARGLTSIWLPLGADNLLGDSLEKVARGAASSCLPAGVKSASKPCLVGVGKDPGQVA